MTADGQCPPQCTENEDADCCADVASRGQKCELLGGQCACRALPEEMCSDDLDGVCPAMCDMNNDRDCCEDMGVGGGSCFYNPPMNGQPGSCGCAVPGPFVPPRMAR